MKLIFCTIVLPLLFLAYVKSEISNTKGQEKDVDFEDFVDVKDERTTLEFEFNRKFHP